MYVADKKGNGHRRLLSKFLSLLGSGLATSLIIPKIVLPSDEETREIELDIDGALVFAESQISLFGTCPRRFFYTHILKTGGRRVATPFMQMHEAAQSVTRRLVDCGGTSESDLGTLVADACSAAGLQNNPQFQDYVSIAGGLVDYFIANLGNGLVAKHAFSSKPTEGYKDYHHKMTTYASIIAGPAAVITPGTSAQPFTVPEEGEDCVFNYTETASDRVGIGALTQQLKGHRIAIIGVGGTGSYILDLVAKTPVREIRLIDGDEFLQHNAFRAPGAPTIDELRDAPRKVDYLHDIYSKMHRGIISYPVAIGPDNLDLLDGLDFAFLSMDDGVTKKAAVEKLEAIGASFIDVGMGLQLDGGSLGGILRVTASTPTKRRHIHAGGIPFEGGGADDVYTTNIQVAELNALNAALAVIKWKKLCGFYRDLENEHWSLYTTDSNDLINGETDEDA